MRRLRWIVISGLALSLEAQTPVRVKFDTEQVRVVSTTERPHQARRVGASNMNRVIVFLGDSQVTISSSGKQEKRAFKPGDAMWNPAGAEFIIENTGGTPVDNVLIELKKEPTAEPRVSELDTVRVDPMHYKLEFENRQVRILRVRYGPREDGARHEHILSRVVVYVTDQLNGTKGTVNMAGPSIHAETNASDLRAERIAVELK